MSVLSELSRLNGLKTTIRSKLISLGALSSSATSADLEDCSTAINAIDKKTASDVTNINGVVTIPAGYYPEGITLQVGVEVVRLI